MLQNLERKTTYPSKSSRNNWLIPDPWTETTASYQEQPITPINSMSKSARESSLIPPAGNPEALELPPPTVKTQLSSLKMLVEDELKLHNPNPQLASQVQDALTLLYWLEIA